jgi:hypothetical protein
MAGGRDIKPWLRRSHTAGGEQGFSLALALLVVLGALSAAVAITGRTLSNRQARQQLDAGLTARNAAEIGMTRIIAELNRPRNRRLLVNAPQLGAEGKTVDEIQSSDENPLINPCATNSLPPDISTNGTFSRTSSSDTVLNREVSIPNTNMRYSLIAVRNGPNDNEQSDEGEVNESFDVTTGSPGPPGTRAASGTITLDVRGRVVESNGSETSRFNLRKTFAVIPKCCDSSFGGFQGTGTTQEFTPTRWENDSTNCAVASGYGLILGARRELSPDAAKGSFSSTFAIYRQRVINDPSTNTLISRVFCTVNKESNIQAADCPFTAIFSNARSRTSMTRKNIILPPVPLPANSRPFDFASNQYTLSQFQTTRCTSGSRGTFPNTCPYPTNFFNTSTCDRGICEVPGWVRMRVCDAGLNSEWSGATGSGSGLTSPRSTSVADLTSTSPTLGCRITVNEDETLNTREFDTSWRSSPRNTLKWQLGHLCRRIDWNGVNTIYCNLDQLNLEGNVTITFDTAGNADDTSIPIVLSFPNGSTNSSSPRDIIKTESILGVTRGEIRQINSRRADRPLITDLSIYGCAINQSSSCRFQRILSNGFTFFGINTGINSLRITNAFVYAPYANLQARVSALNFTGSYWGNRLTQSVSESSFIIPTGSTKDVVDGFPDWTPAELDLEQDYVARSVISVGTFSD